MESEYIEVLGRKVPLGTFPCWIISEDNRLNALRNNKPFDDSSPSCYFKITNRLDNNFIEGNLGHSEFKGKFHNTIHYTGYTYLQDYNNRIPVYFSFDNISLYRLIEILPTNPSTYILKRIDNPNKIVPNKAFMIMPFKYDYLNSFYMDHIKVFLKAELGIDIYRADDFNDNDIIIDTIYKQIDESEFIIADTSQNNKNAFYEIGYSAAKEKEIITIQDLNVESTLFFDRSHIRAIFYSLENIENFQKQLKDTIIAIRSKVSARG